MRIVISFTYALPSNALKLSAADGAHSEDRTQQQNNAANREQGAAQRNRDSLSHTHARVYAQRDSC